MHGLSTPKALEQIGEQVPCGGSQRLGKLCETTSSKETRWTHLI